MQFITNRQFRDLKIVRTILINAIFVVFNLRFLQKFRILDSQFQRLTKEIIELTPEYWEGQEELLYKVSLDSQGQAIGHSGLTYNKYRTVRVKLREGAFLPKKRKGRKQKRRSRSGGRFPQFLFHMLNKIRIF